MAGRVEPMVVRALAARVVLVQQLPVGHAISDTPAPDRKAASQH